jgi:glucosamine--fructose-6-phosphate aminotransferase (isomerizing)
VTANDTHMRREINEIPDAAARFLESSDKVLAEAGRDIRARNPSFLVTVARGSSDHAASFMKYAVELTAGIPVASVGPSVASIYGASLKLAGSACLAISQSGRSPDIVAMAEEAKRGGALAIALTNTADSPLARACDHAIDIMAGAEKSVAATKTFVNSAVAGLALMAYCTADQPLLAALRELPGHFRKAVGCDWMEIAGALEGASSLFILGRGPSFAIANEAALKFKETCGMHAEAYSAAEVMHGPLALVTPGFPVLALAARDASEPSMAETADALQARQAAVFITSDHAKNAALLPFAATGHPLTDPLALIVSFYGFVEAFARHRGLNPDEPRNLKKVTETV